VIHVPARGEVERLAVPDKILALGNRTPGRDVAAVHRTPREIRQAVGRNALLGGQLPGYWNACLPQHDVDLPQVLGRVPGLGLDQLQVGNRSPERLHEGRGLQPCRNPVPCKDARDLVLEVGDHIDQKVGLKEGGHLHRVFMLGIAPGLPVPAERVGAGTERRPQAPEVILLNGLQ
jgi:hypothetical protein